MLIGEIQADGQINMVWKTPGVVQAELVALHPRERQPREDPAATVTHGECGGAGRVDRRRRHPAEGHHDRRSMLRIAFSAAPGPAGRGRRTPSPPPLPGLAGGFSDVAASVDRLGALGDPRALPLLQALQDGKLQSTADGRLLLPTGDAAPSMPRPAQPADARRRAEAVRLNNRVRQALRGALGRLQLVPPIRASGGGRRRASAAAAPRTCRCCGPRSRGAGPAVRATMEFALAAAQLVAPDEAAKRAASPLGAAGSVEARALLDRGCADIPASSPPPRRRVATIDKQLQIRRMAETLFQGLSLGSVLLLAALGLAITFGVMGVINMAHGEFVMLGAYATFVVQELFRASPGRRSCCYLLVRCRPPSWSPPPPASLLERGLIRLLYGRPLETLLMTFGVGMILQQAVRVGFGAQNREVTPRLDAGHADLPGGVAVTQNRLWIIFFGLAVLAMASLLRLTRFGLEMRAVTQNRRIAATMGIRTGAGGRADLRLRLGPRRPRRRRAEPDRQRLPQSRPGYIIDSFMVVVFGGVGICCGHAGRRADPRRRQQDARAGPAPCSAKVFVLVAIILFIQRRPHGPVRAARAGPPKLSAAAACPAGARRAA